MNDKVSQIEIIPYDPNWPKQFQQVAEFLKKILGTHCLNVHHIGSTAVPGLSAKPKIDVMCIVDQLDHALILQDHGYEFRGEWNIPMRYGFSYRSDDLNVNLHVVEPDHSFIPLNLTFRDYLREDDQARDEYDALKIELLKDPSSHKRVQFGLPMYTLRKDALIKRFLEEAGYQGFGLNLCVHPHEWEEYHQILGKEAEDDPNHFHFIFYMGAKIIGAAHVEFLSERKCALRALMIDPPVQEKEMLKRIKKWFTLKGRNLTLPGS